MVRFPSIPCSPGSLEPQSHAPFCRLLASQVLEEPSGRSKGCGLVEYATQEEANCAIAQLSNTELEGRLIFVREDREPDGGSISRIAKRQPPMLRGASDGRQLYVGNVSRSSWSLLASSIAHEVRHRRRQ